MSRRQHENGKTTKLKDNFWLWGQDAGSHHAARGNKEWKLPGINRMEPAEGAEYLGIRNVCRVVMDDKPQPPFDLESEKLKNMNKVVWSAIGDSWSFRNDNDDSDLDEVLRQAEKYPNISGAVLDDFFFSPAQNQGKVARGHSVQSIQNMRRRLHKFPLRPLDLWVVWYKQQLDWPVQEYLKLFDVVTYWNMKAPAEIAELDDDFGKVVQLTPGKRRLAGCYMWNYGEGKPLSIREIETECNKYYEWLRKGHTAGIIFCSNCCADLGLEAVKWVRGWIREAGEETV